MPYSTAAAEAPLLTQDCQLVLNDQSVSGTVYTAVTNSGLRHPPGLSRLTALLRTTKAGERDLLSPEVIVLQ